MYRRFSIDDDVLMKVLAALQELHSLKVERATSIQPDSIMSKMLAEMAKIERKEIASLSHTMATFRDQVEWGYKEPTPNEELDAVDAVIIKLIGSERFYPERRAALIDNIVKDAENKRQRAWAMFAKLADDIRIKMLAIKYLLDRAPHAGNHHEKNRRITEVGELIVTVIEEMAKVKEPTDYDSHRTHFTSGSWNYIQAMTEIHHKTQDMENTEEQLQAAVTKIKEMQAELDRMYAIVGRQDENVNDTYGDTNPSVLDGVYTRPIKPTSKLVADDEIAF